MCEADVHAFSVAERRKAWLYETPLSAQHHLRSALNDPNTLDPALVDKFDLPVVASVTKLWLLELDIPIILFSHYDEYRSLYPKRVGAEVVDVPAKAIADHVSRLPPVHLEVLRVLMQHFTKLIHQTKTDESDDVFLQKLALSLARCVLRPKVETPISLDDRFPSLLFVDLVKNFDVIFDAADELKSKQREDRYAPFPFSFPLRSRRMANSNLTLLPVKMRIVTNPVGSARSRPTCESRAVASTPAARSTSAKGRSSSPNSATCSPPPLLLPSPSSPSTRTRSFPRPRHPRSSLRPSPLPPPSPRPPQRRTPCRLLTTLSFRLP